MSVDDHSWRAPYRTRVREHGSVRALAVLLISTLAAYALGFASPKGEPGSGTLPITVGALCTDGTTSSATGQGACSHHGGVLRWITKDVMLEWPADPKKARDRQIFFWIGHSLLAVLVLSLVIATRSPREPVSKRIIPATSPPIRNDRSPLVPRGVPLAGFPNGASDLKRSCRRCGGTTFVTASDEATRQECLWCGLALEA